MQWVRALLAAPKSPQLEQAKRQVAECEATLQTLREGLASMRQARPLRANSAPSRSPAGSPAGFAKPALRAHTT